MLRKTLSVIASDSEAISISRTENGIALIPDSPGRLFLLPNDALILFCVASLNNIL